MRNSITNYNQTVRFIESLSNVVPLRKERDVKTAKERLENIKRFLKFLGNPEKKLKIIHIAGTSGKGSVVAMLHSILNVGVQNSEPLQKEPLQKAGSYTSPHTTTYCERIKVGDK
ncbi:hypothetical protein KJ885_01335, partial [Patescibacteria group bacterium]|nr:hypothetical protein [Patescibacteria group bacterium]